MAKRSIARRFGQEVAKRRKLAGMTQEALAAKAGVHRTYVGDVENARKSPTIERASNIAAALGTTLGELVQAAEHGGAV